MDDDAGKARIDQKSLPADAGRIGIPAVAIAQWLADIDDIVELKVTLRALALLADEPQRRSTPPSIALDDLLDDRFLTRGVPGSADGDIRQGLAAAIGRGTLVALRDPGTIRVLLNDEHCRRYLGTAAVFALTGADLLEQAGDMSPEEGPHPASITEPRANIFALYEQHIGSYGHSIAEQLRAAEEEYPAEWIADAIAIAAERNARSWPYIDGVLRKWKQERQPGLAVGITDRTRDTNYEHGEPGSDTPPDSLERYPYLESYWRRHGRLPWEPGEPEQR